MSNITIIGLDKNGVYLEDLRVEVPYQTAVTLPAHSIASRKLAEALNHRRLFQLKGTLPSGASFRGGVAVPRAAAPPPRRHSPPTKEVDGQEQLNLKAENARLQQQLAEQKTLNTGLQTTLSAMSGQLTAIQGVLEDLKKQGVTVSSMSGIPITQKLQGIDDDTPMFIPSVKRDDVQANFSVEGKESKSSLDESKSALKALRKQKKQG